LHNKTQHHTSHDTVVTIILAFANSWNDVINSVTNAAVTLLLVTVVWITLAPLFGVTARGGIKRKAGQQSEYNHYYSGDYDDNYYQSYYNQGRSLVEEGIVKRMGKVLINRLA